MYLQWRATIPLDNSKSLHLRCFSAGGTYVAGVLSYFSAGAHRIGIEYKIPWKYGPKDVLAYSLGNQWKFHLAEVTVARGGLCNDSCHNEIQLSDSYVAEVASIRNTNSFAQSSCAIRDSTIILSKSDDLLGTTNH